MTGFVLSLVYGPLPVIGFLLAFVLVPLLVRLVRTELTIRRLRRPRRTPTAKKRIEPHF